MSQLEPYLFFNGNCAEAMRFYEKTLDGKLEMMMKASEAPGGAGAGCPEGNPDAILHASVLVEGRHLMASDWMGQEPYPGIHGVSISLLYPSVADARRKFEALSTGGKVVMPMDKTFWVEAFGMLTDRFGVNWMISGGKQANS